MIRICPVCDKIINLIENDYETKYAECETSIPFHFYRERCEEDGHDYIEVQKGLYIIGYGKRSCILQIWIEISGKGSKHLYSIPYDFEQFSKLCKLDDNVFNSKLRLLQVFS